MMRMMNEVLLAISSSPAASILAKVSVTTALALAGTQLARKSRAAARHVVLAAAFAVLVVLPIVAIVAPPVRVEVPIAAQGTAPSSVEATIDAIAPAASADAAAGAPAIARSSGLSLSALFLAGWSAGTMLFLAPVIVGLWQLRSLQRSGLPWRRGHSVVDALALDADIHRRVEVLLHESMPGPTTFGVLHPTIVLPLDAQTWADEDLRRAIVHELEHVRRGDWVSQCVARAVCACYWFHPLVWVAWRQLALEAERACDDAVLRRAEATGYADQLVALAQRLSTAAKPPLLAMANRADLATRVVAVLDSRQRRGRAGGRWVCLACAASALLVTAISPLHLVAVAPTPESGAQPAPDARTFDVASIKACKDDPPSSGQRRPEYTVSPGRARIQCLTVERIIYIAYAGIGNMNDRLLNDYGFDPTHVRGGPGWIRSEKFTIEATAEGTSDRTVMMGPMLRALLEERFQLKTHREVEEAPMYALTVSKRGLKIQPLAEGGCTSHEAVQDLSREEIMAVNQGAKPVCGSFSSIGDGANRVWSLGGESLSKFANSTLSGVLDRYVLDKTGVTGVFNIHLKFGLDESIRAGVFGGRAATPPPPDVEKGPSIFTALEEQLGLKLERTKGPRGFFVIDRVARPSAN